MQIPYGDYFRTKPSLSAAKAKKSPILQRFNQGACQIARNLGSTDFAQNGNHLESSSTGSYPI
jgi:hypothetical protein